MFQQIIRTAQKIVDSCGWEAVADLFHRDNKLYFYYNIKIIFLEDKIMKLKKKLLFFMFLPMFFCIIDCKTFDTSLLQATDQEIDPKISRLLFETQLNQSSYMYTVC